ncbi:MAG: class I SAM-dependent methyltransferase [Syntrophaceae bacterium]|nr:class I SAM-dependent methyltransferase [Syntrophaceae bacterium]
MTNNYRARIYNAYDTGRQQNLSPDSLAGLKPRLPMLQKLVRQHFLLDVDASILDLGCGHGALIHVARQMGYRNIRGVDGSPEQVAAARRLKIDGVSQGDVLEVLSRQPDCSLDCIVAFDLIEHFTKNELIGLVDEVHRVLKPGGRWIIHTPNAESPFGNRIFFGDFTHELAFTRTSLAQLLLSSGFSSVSSFEDQPVPHGIKSLARWMLWKMFRSVLRLYLVAETGDSGRDSIFSQNLFCVAFK